MAYFITERCEKAGVCLPVCPVEAISETDGNYVIDAEVCVDCGACAASCPHGAIEAQ